MPPNEERVTKDDLFDLAYWTWRLNQAQLWWERMGLSRSTKWEDVRLHLAKLPEKDG